MDKDSTKVEKTIVKTPFRKIMDRLDGNTFELKKECAAVCGKHTRTIERYYWGRLKVLDMDFASKFILWANEKRVPGSPEILLSDLLTNS